jgi:peptidoglycan/xylan/chitin deacetylase (PgdA/CDA1 family)
MAKLPILMYHDISLTKSEGLTISVAAFEAQLKYLSNKNYSSYHCKELLQLTKLPSKKNVVITFDDGFVSQLELAVPLLKKYNFKATFFIPLQYIGKNDAWHTKRRDIMTTKMLQSLDPSIIELAHHSFAHKKYDALSTIEIEEDIAGSFDAVEKNGLLLAPALAYPYGKYPRKKSMKEGFIKQLQEHQFLYGLRIGNRVNRFPFKNPFEIQRVDVKGEFSMSKFKRRLTYGKLF